MVRRRTSGRGWPWGAGLLLGTAWLSPACVVPEYYIDQNLGGASGGNDALSGGTNGESGGSTSGGGTDPGSSGGDQGNGSGGGSDSGGGGGTGGSGGSGGTGGGGSGGTGGGGSGGTGGTCFAPPSLPGTFPQDWTAGSVVQINDDGAWSWLSGPRAVVDVAAGKLVVSSVGAGPGGAGSVDVVLYDLATTNADPYSVGTVPLDDRGSAALLVKGSGQYLATWTPYQNGCDSSYNHFGSGNWGTAASFEWASLGCPWTFGANILGHSNLWEMSDESAYYNILRSVDGAPNLLVSSDLGQTWQYGGQLTAPTQVGAPFGYYSFAGNGVDRIDFVGIPSHPRDTNTSLFHGYLEAEAVHDSLGVVVDDDVTDVNASDLATFTPVFTAGGSLGGVDLDHLWNLDVVSHGDTVLALWQARVEGSPSSAPDLRFGYSRFSGGTWTSTYLAKAGPGMDAAETDYTGGAVLDPDHPEVLYISTKVDPRDDATNLAHFEIWKGVTCDDGATFDWTPITMNSTIDNLRPVVPKWDAEHSAVLWFRGTYTSDQTYDTEVVALLPE